MLSLGMEFSTQSVKLLVLDILSGDTVYSGAFRYDETFPRYMTVGGVLPHDDPRVRQTSPHMLLDAMDHAFAVLAGCGAAMDRVTALKVDAMQHCTVCAGEGFSAALASLVTDKSLDEQLGPFISRERSPIWEDRSTENEARLLEEAVRHHGGMAALCGNRAEPRFAAAQVLKWAADSPGEYRATSNIMLLSAFMTSILAGRPCPADTGDGWGTNFNSLDIDIPGWSDAILFEFDNLLEDLGAVGTVRKKIGSMCAYDTPMGTINPYFAARYGMDPDCVVLAGTGDNPATLLGCGGRAVVSLGSSYTVNGAVAAIAPSRDGDYNLFGYIPGNAISLSVFTNGGRVHDEFMKRYILSGADGIPGATDWDEYAARTGDVQLAPGEPLMLSYLLDESVPRRPASIAREGFDDGDASVNIRALHVSQALSLRLHSGHLGNVPSLCVAGGGSRNRFLRQMIADAFNAETYTIENAEYAAALGCAVSGACRLLGLSHEEAAARFVKKAPGSAMLPLPKNRGSMAGLLSRYAALERKHARPE